MPAFQQKYWPPMTIVIPSMKMSHLPGLYSTTAVLPAIGPAVVVEETRVQFCLDWVGVVGEAQAGLDFTCTDRIELDVGATEVIRLTASTVAQQCASGELTSAFAA